MVNKPVQKPFKKLNKIKDTNNTSDGFFTNFFALIILFLTGSVVFVAILLPFFILASVIPVIGVPIIAILSGFALQRCLTVFIFFILTGKIKP